MIKIKTKADLTKLKASAEISPAYYDLVETYFLQLVESLCPPDVDPGAYSLELDGYIVVLQSQDDPFRLPEVGFPDGLVSSFPGPEWMELHCLADGLQVLQIAYLLDNDFMMIFYVDQALWQADPLLVDFVQDNLEEGL